MAKKAVKSSKTSMTRRGVTYRIERNADGTFGRFIPLNTASAKKASKKVAAKSTSTKKASAKVSSNTATKRNTTKSTSKRARA